MVEERGLGKRSMFTGKSVHNFRVALLHRDVYIGVLSHFVSIFSGLESSGLLDPDIEVHVCALHFISVPIIN